MNVQNLPNQGDKLFLMHREVVVTNVYALFQLIKIRYTEDVFEFFVDISALTTVPIYTSSISIGILRGLCGE